MSLSELHSIPEFVKLFDDPRFKAAITYARANFANKATTEAGEWRGWYACLDNLEALKSPPRSQSQPVQAPAPYTKLRSNDEAHRQPGNPG